MNREKSLAAFTQALKLMPGGVNSPARAFGAVGGTPIFFDRGEGPYLFDLDGNRYVDLVGSWGPLIFGHAYPPVIKAVDRALQKGTSFGAPTLAESELAALIIEFVPAIQKVRLVNSGTEATMSAIRLARGFTGRELIIKFAGNYHGHVDSLLVAAGSAAMTLSVPNSPGITKGTSKDTLVLNYNDVESLELAFEDFGERIAAVIVEPVAGNMGCVVASTEFREALRGLTQHHGALLICDEVMSGFRVHPGGATARFELPADIVTLGKIVGGGMPLGAYGGRADIMDHILPAGKVFQAGTLSGNPVATAAGIAMLKSLKSTPPYERLEILGAELESRLTQSATRYDIPHQVTRVGSMITLFFSDQPVVDLSTAAESDTERYAKFFWNMADRGVYLPCSQFEAMFLSSAISDADLETVATAADEALAALRD